MPRNYLGYGNNNNPMLNSLAGFSMVNNAFGNLRERQQEEKLKNVLANTDMENPDYTKMLSIAPKFTLKFMNTIQGLDQNKRLQAVQAAKNINDFLKPALMQLSANPGARPQIFDALRKIGASEEFANAILPNPQDYVGNQQGWLNATQGAVDANQIIQQNTAKLKANLAMAVAQEKTKQVGMKTASDEKIESMKQAIAYVQNTSRPKSWFNTKDGLWNTTRMMPDGKVVTETHPEGYVPEGVVQKMSGGTGKGSSKVQPPTRRLRGGQSTGAGEFDPTDLSGYNRVLATKDPDKIAEAQRRMQQKYGRLPE